MKRSTITISHKWRALLALAFIIACLTMATGFQGYGPVTTAQIAFNAATVPGVSVTFQNVSQASHWLTVCPTGAVSAIQIELDASFDGVTWFSITPPGTTLGPGCYTLEAGGYFPNVHANLVSIAGGGSVTAYYSSSAFPIPDGGIGQMGKSSQPVTFVAPTYQRAALGFCATPIPLGSPGPIVVYGLHLTNNDTQTIFFEVTDTVGSGAVRFDQIYTITASNDKEVVFPTEGVQFRGAVQITTCTAASGNPGSLPIAVLMYKTNPTVTTQAGSGGIVAQTKSGAAQ